MRVPCFTDRETEARSRGVICPQLDPAASSASAERRLLAPQKTRDTTAGRDRDGGWGMGEAPTQAGGAGGGQLSAGLSVSVTRMCLAGCGWNDSAFISPPGLGWGLDTYVPAPGLPPACCGAEGRALTSRASISPEIGQDDLRD